MRNALQAAWSRLRRLPWYRFGAGVLAGAAGLALTFLLRIYVLGVFVPEVAVDFAVAIIPGSVESFFIRTMGEGAKLLALTVALAVFLALPGVYATFYRQVERWFRNRWTVIAVYTFGSAAVNLYFVLPLIGGGFTGSETAQGTWAAIFSQLLGGWLYAAVLDHFLVDMRAKHPQGFNPSRRQFLAWSLAVVAATLLTLYGISRLLPTRVGRLAFASIAELLAKEVTPTPEFYVVTKNLVDPTVDEQSWRLVVDGLVASPRTYTIDELRAMAAVEEFVTLECVSNEVGGNLISTAKWSGIRLRDLIAASAAEPGADWVLFTCADDYTVAIPLARAEEPTTLLALRINDVILPVNHGFPARIVVPGLYGMFHAKWVTRATLVQGEVLGFWQRKGWTNRGPVRTTAIVTTPPDDAVVPGTTTIGGIAFAGDRGISRVEVSTDGGTTWSPATLKAPPLSALTWVLWTYQWTPPGSGAFRILARAVDGDGVPQERAPEGPFPNGAAGFDAITLLVSA